MSELRRSTGYSATVELELIIGDRVISLHEISPDSIRLREPCEMPPCDAIVVLRIDDRENRWAVYLPDGLSATSLSARTILRERLATAAR